MVCEPLGVRKIHYNLNNGFLGESGSYADQ